MGYLNNDEEEDIEFTYSVRSSAFHLAGIIPVHGQPLDYQLAWSPVLTQVAPSFTAIENAVTECLYAGCESIWIVVNEGATPLIRHMLGEVAEDAIYVDRYSDPQYRVKNKKYVPIKYIPTNPMNRDRRDSLSYSVLRGCYVSSKVTAKISKWCIPDRFYVSFPYGIFDYKEIRKYRQKISSKHPFVVKYQDESYKDGLHLSFTMNHGDWKNCKNDVNNKETGYRDLNDEEAERNKWGVPMSKLPSSEQYTARWYTPKEVFATVSEEKATYCDVSWFHDISSWEGYRNFMRSDKEIERPAHDVLRYREWNPVGVDLEDDDNL